VAALFFSNGAVFSTVVPRYPELKADLGLGNAALGTALAAFPAGALVAGLLAAALIGRFGSARVASVGIVLLGAAVVALAAVQTWAALAATMFVAGAIDAVVDVAQNAHGLRVQRRYGRSIVNAFHAVWSIGAVAGGLVGTAAAGLDIPLGVHLCAMWVVVAGVALIASRFLLPGPDGADRTAPHPAGSRRDPPRRRDSLRVLTGLGLVAACDAVVEDAAASWGALYLRTEIGATAATAGLAFASFQVAMTAGRLLGDRFVDRVGRERAVRTGGLLTAVAMVLAIATPSMLPALAGFALAGLGVATLVPTVMHAADDLPGLPAGAGLAGVSWMLRIGFVASPPLVGVVADALDLRAALLGVVAAGIVVAAIAPVAGTKDPGRVRTPHG
jgi:MFS family permease